MRTSNSLISPCIVVNYPYQLMRKRYLAIIVAVVVVATNGARATTVVYVTSSCGMAVGADGKIGPAGTAVKIALLKQRLVVADLYYERATSGGAVVYDFPTWVKQIDNSTDADISVSGLAQVIKTQMTSTFRFASEAIKDGTLTKEKAATWGAETYLVQYVVAGYEHGVPLVYSLTLMPDWDAKTVNGPFEVVLKKVEPKNTALDFGWRGRGTGLNLINTANTEPERKLNALIKAELDLTHSGHCLASEHLSNVARAMLVIETEYDPHYVGFPLTVIALSKNGNGTATTCESNLGYTHCDSTGASEGPKIIDVPDSKFQSKSQTAAKPVPLTVFILSNGDRVESSHYILTVDSVKLEQGQTQRTIPVSAINMNATIAANRERGIDLKFPRNRVEITLGF